MPDFASVADIDAFSGLAKEWLEYERTASPRVRYRTGFFALDGAIGGGIEQASLAVVGGLTGSGKTPMLNAIALGLAKGGTSIAFAPLELGAAECRNRFLSSLHRSSYDGFRSDFESGVSEYEAMVRSTLHELDALPIKLIDRERARNRTIRELFEWAWKEKAQVLVVDHARELAGWNMKTLPSGFLGAEAVAIEIAELAYNSRISCVIAQQLDSRRVGRTERPGLEHLRDTQKLAELSDLVLIPHRPYRGDREHDHVAELILSKNRRGPEPILHLGWHGPSMRFSSPADSYGETQLERVCCGEDAPTPARSGKRSR